MKIVETFKKDQKKLEKFTKTIKVGKEELVYDFSKTHLDSETLNKYIEKFKKINIQNKIEDMFKGEKINFTEERKVLHVILRDKEVLAAVEKENSDSISGDKLDVYNELIKIKDLCVKFHSKKLIGVSGKPLDTVVNIGIGGSDLGPRMVCDALRHYKVDQTKCHFISNVDATETIDVFDSIDPETTLFVVVSKTFTTIETIKNAELAIKYMSEKLGKDKDDICKKHFIAVSSNLDEVSKYNIDKIFAMWDYVGGRFSLWSAVGISIALYIGFDNFIKLLKGASELDNNFRSSNIENNIELLHSIIEIYYNENGYNNKCLVAYDQYLEKLYLYLQQAEMESNGKYKEKGDTGMIIWGGIGTNTQHSFFQLLHQGTRKILSEFLVPFTPIHKETFHHNLIISNCLAQSRALMVGKKGEVGKDDFKGDKPSITVGYSLLTPEILGAIIAHYEHKIFIQGVYWGINSFDQFGVTLGKKIAVELFEDINDGKNGDFDESTTFLIKNIKRFKK